MTIVTNLNSLADEIEFCATHQDHGIALADTEWAARLRSFAKMVDAKLNEAQQFFGPCWCKSNVGYKCPQCEWKELLHGS